MDFFGTYMSKPVMTFRFTVLRNGLLRYLFHTCPNLLTFVFKLLWKWFASVHTTHMSKPVMTFVFKVLRNGCFASVHTYTHMSIPMVNFGFIVLHDKKRGISFLTAFITNFIVLQLGSANFALGVMALPLKIAAHEHQGFSKNPQIPHFSFQTLI